LALDPNPIGKTIADYLYQNTLSQAGSPVSKANVEAIWIQIMTYIYNDIKSNADVVPVAHSGENLSAPSGQPVQTNDAQGGTNTGTVTADTPCVGMGSIV
jgi:hypothetical protein